MVHFGSASLVDFFFKYIGTATELYTDEESIRMNLLQRARWRQQQ